MVLPADMIPSHNQVRGDVRKTTVEIRSTLEPIGISAYRSTRVFLLVQGSQPCGPQDDNFGPSLRINMKIFESIGMLSSELFLRKT